VTDHKKLELKIFEIFYSFSKVKKLMRALPVWGL